MRPDHVKSIDDQRKAMEVVCPICSADVDCACDTFQRPKGIPTFEFVVHIERLELAQMRAESCGS